MNCEPFRTKDTAKGLKVTVNATIADHADQIIAYYGRAWPISLWSTSRMRSIAANCLRV